MINAVILALEIEKKDLNWLNSQNVVITENKYFNFK
jgi:hypothetical protein